MAVCRPSFVTLVESLGEARAPEAALGYLRGDIREGQPDEILSRLDDLSSHGVTIPPEDLSAAIAAIRRPPGRPNDHSFAEMMRKYEVAESLGVARGLYFSGLAFRNLQEASEAARNIKQVVSESTQKRFTKNNRVAVIWGETRCMKGLVELGRISIHGPEIERWRASLGGDARLSMWEEEDPNAPWAGQDQRLVQEFLDLLNLE